MPLELFPIQLPTTSKGSARTPLLLLFDGSGFAFEYTTLLPLDRLVYGASIVVPNLHTDGMDKKAIQMEYEDYLAREFSTIDDYLDQLVRLIEEEVFNAQDDDYDDMSSESDSEGTQSDHEMDSRVTSAQEGCTQRTFSLHIGGFSFGGFLAIELARRLASQVIHTTTNEAPILIDIPSVILFDSYNPTAPQVRITYKQVTSAGRPQSLPDLARYSDDHPLMSFIRAHLIHFTKLVADWKLQPFAPKAGEFRAVPPVHYLRALPGCMDDVVDPEECTGYWTKRILPTLDLGKLKVVEKSDHLGIWKPGKVEQVTEWLKDILSD